MKKRKALWIAGLSALGVLAVAGGAYAYTVNNSLSSYAVIIKQNGSYTMVGGDNVQILLSPWPTLTGQTVKIALERFTVANGSMVPDAQGPWGVMLADMQGVDINNGYLLIAAPPQMGGNSPDVQEVVTRLGGNFNYVLSYLEQNHRLIKTYDLTNRTYYYYVPFADVVTESGSEFGPGQLSQQ
jgi:hypothetical protein